MELTPRDVDIREGAKNPTNRFISGRGDLSSGSGCGRR